MAAGAPERARPVFRLPAYRSILRASCSIWSAVDTMRVPAA
jgi:hypothetical protein